MIRPPALRKGDTIGVMAPSSRIVDGEKFNEALQRIESYGYRIFVHPQTWAMHGQSAGTGVEKAAAFHDLLRNDDIRAILCARGGNRTGTMLPHLDFDLIHSKPKIVMGYSDISALLNAVFARTGLVGFHGPMVYRLFEGLPPVQLDQAFALLSGGTPCLPLDKTTIVKQGIATGALLGGNLSVMCSLIGTSYAPDFTDTLFFLEDVGDELSRFDRYFLHMHNAGVFDRIAGLIVGGFTELQDSGRVPFGFTIPDIIRDITSSLSIPVVLDAPFGHGADLYTLPVGLPATLAATAQGASLTLDGPAVSV